MAQQGAEIGAHTVEHAILPNESPERMARELVESKAELERRLGREVICFAYPDGRYDRSVVDTVARAGFTIAVTTEDRIADSRTSALLLPRKTLWEMSSRGFFGSSRAVLAAQLAHLYGSLRLQRPLDGFSSIRP